MKAIVLALLLALSACAAPLPRWQGAEGLDQPHVGQVWVTAEQRWISPQALVKRLATAPHVVVGEQHDNPDHHRLQLWLLQQLQAARPQQSLLLEMLQPAQQAAVAALQGRVLPDDKALQRQLEWQAGWDWAMYGPLVRWGLAVPAQLLAANLDRDSMMALYRAPQPLNERYTADARRQLSDTIEASHCGRIDAQQVQAMLSIQQARDQAMAAALAGAPAPALLLAGNYHARRDLGVPLHWPAQQVPPLVLQLQEVGDAPLPSEQQADYLWLTPATPTRDYCAD
ncbi:ChaN family lipoprotein [Halopseudomonas maritima]|uniref:ChaN family lipoprotein n=1 Tax=Halopseudomonas maritima TaxID=2918528 RepID=UPI001EEC9B2D|nr:ChaN family lipoprotein [Halopseudomonas maritima]UJJ30473.1 ChaN family lipoprotein [Halopseudomonas maritima]